MVVIAIFTERLYVNITLAYRIREDTENQVILSIFMLSCSNVFEVTMNCLRIVCAQI